MSHDERKDYGNKRGECVRMCYNVVGNYRSARRKESVVLFNSYNGECVELDKKSEDILNYIKMNHPNRKEIVNYAIGLDVLPQSTEELLSCLKETGFIYED